MQVARGKAKDLEFDLESIEDQLEDLDLDGDDLDLDDSELLLDDDDLDLDDDDVEDLADDGEDEVTFVEIDGEEVEITEKSLSKLKKPQVVKVMEALNEDGYGIDTPRTAKKDIIIQAILDADAQQNNDTDSDEEEELDEKPVQAVAPWGGEAVATTAKPQNQQISRVPVDKERLDLVLAALRLREAEVVSSDSTTAEKKAAIAQLTYCEQLISLFLKTW